MQNRGSERTKHRAPCSVTIAGRRYNGFVIDFSVTGLFIQTSATPRPGQRIDLDVTLKGEALSLHVEVARRKAVPPQLRSVAHGGVGVHIVSAPETFYQLLADTEGPVSGGELRAGAAAEVGTADSKSASAALDPDDIPLADEAPGEAQLKRAGFRVRVGQRSGTRTRVLRIQCEDEEAARREVLEDLGDDWKVLEIELT